MWLSSLVRFGITSKREPVPVHIPTGIPLDKLQTTCTPCISYTCAKERLMIDRLCLPTGVGNDKFDGRV
jgi:hypothetical protein